MAEISWAMPCAHVSLARLRPHDLDHQLTALLTRTRGLETVKSRRNGGDAELLDRGARLGAIAHVTSWPPSRRASASGTIGYTWPVPAVEVTNTRVAVPVFVPRLSRE
jgi:hypothetical protein